MWDFHSETVFGYDVMTGEILLTKPFSPIPSYSGSARRSEAQEARPNILSGCDLMSQHRLAEQRLEQWIAETKPAESGFFNAREAVS